MERRMSQETKRALGQAIKAARLGANLSQEELAARLALDQNAVSRLESGYARWPDPGLLAAIAAETGVSAAEFLTAAGYLPEVTGPAPAEPPTPRLYTMLMERMARDLTDDDRQVVDESIRYAQSIWRQRRRQERKREGRTS